MISYFSELRYKEVVDVPTGFRLGYVCDAEVDRADGRILALITPAGQNGLVFLDARTTIFCLGVVLSA